LQYQFGIDWTNWIFICYNLLEIMDLKSVMARGEGKEECNNAFVFIDGFTMMHT